VLLRYGCKLTKGVYAIVGVGQNGQVLLRSVIGRGNPISVEPSRIQPRIVEAHVAAVTEDRFTLQTQRAAQQARAGVAESQLHELQDESSARASAWAATAGAEQRKAAKTVDDKVRQYNTVTPCLKSSRTCV